MAAQTPPRREEPKYVAKLRARRAEHRERSRIVRAVFVLAGFTLLLAGLVMLVTPGPATAVIPIGLAILSLEFTWAERLLDRALEEADKAARRASETTTMQRVLAGIATALGFGALIAWAVLGDIPLAPV